MLTSEMFSSRSKSQSYHFHVVASAPIANVRQANPPAGGASGNAAQRRLHQGIRGLVFENK